MTVEDVNAALGALLAVVVGLFLGGRLLWELLDAIGRLLVP